MAHLPSSCLLVAEVNAPLKRIISLSRYIIITTAPEMISKEINPKKIIFYSL
jgi:hypothetical protein